MRSVDYVVHLVMSVFLIFGVYQFYFWCQRRKWVPVRRFSSRLDDRLPYWPVWAWIYSFLYYPAIVYTVWIAEDARHFNLLATSYFVLLGMQMAFFLLIPVETPPEWRELNNGQTASERFLRFVHRFDAPSNCFPSMHVSVATLTAMHVVHAPKAHFGPWAFAFPVLIAFSCIFTKQHYLVDLPFGAALGWLAYQVFLWLR